MEYNMFVNFCVFLRKEVHKKIFGCNKGLLRQASYC
jgi:hypothetical protein